MTFHTFHTFTTPFHTFTTPRKSTSAHFHTTHPYGVWGCGVVRNGKMATRLSHTTPTPHLGA